MRQRPEHVVMGLAIAAGIVAAAVVYGYSALAWLAKAAGWV
jgi:hypothetical protein